MAPLFDKVEYEINTESILYGLSFIAASVLGFISRFYYRDFIYSHHFNDLGLADSLPSYFCSLGSTSAYGFFCILFNHNLSYGSVISIMAGGLLYEILPLDPARVFDIKDMIAVVLGAVPVLLIHSGSGMGDNDKVAAK